MVYVFLSFFLSSQAFAQVNVCAPESYLSTPGGNSRVLISKDLGTNICLSTPPGAEPTRYFVNVENESPVSLDFNLSSRAKTDLVSENVPRASSLVLTAGMVSNLNLNISGFQGKNGVNFSEICAKDISQGKFGDKTLNDFLSSRNLNPNLPKDRCLENDIKQIGLNQRDSPNTPICPPGSVDLNQDDNLEPSFQITRLKEEPFCRLQKDIRTCQVKGQRYRCGIRYYFSFYCSDPPCAKRYGPATTIDFLGTPVDAYLTNYQIKRYWDNLGGLKSYRETWDYRWDYPGTDFYIPDGGLSEDQSNEFCAEYPIPPGGSYYIFPVFAANINDSYQTEDQLCETKAFLSYFNPERGIVNITTQTQIEYQRSYSYYYEQCPEGWVEQRRDQEHNNPEWKETVTCTRGTCPKTLFSLTSSSAYMENVTLNSSQNGADKGKASLFLYDLLDFKAAQTQGKDGILSRADITQPNTIKNCVSVKDFSTAGSVLNSESKVPVVILNQINYKPYLISTPEPKASEPYTSVNTILVYKKTDSSVRDWISNSLGGN